MELSYRVTHMTDKTRHPPGRFSELFSTTHRQSESANKRRAMRLWNRRGLPKATIFVVCGPLTLTPSKACHARQKIGLEINLEECAILSATTLTRNIKITCILIFNADVHYISGHSGIRYYE